MSKSKVFLIFLFLLGALSRLEAYHYNFIQPYERYDMNNYNNDNDNDDGLNGGRYERSDYQCSGINKKNCASGVGSGDPSKIAYGIAQKAAQDAKAANDAQMGAAEAASHQVKAELAYKAQQSAKAAEAALAGKQQILDQTRLELVDADSALATITDALPQFAENSEMLHSVANKAEKQLAYIRKTVDIATAHLEHDQKVSKGAQVEVVEKTAILDAAKQRLENLNNRLSEATKDLDATKAAAYKATCAAVEAKQKAQRARRGLWYPYDDLLWG